MPCQSTVVAVLLECDASKQLTRRNENSCCRLPCNQASVKSFESGGQEGLNVWLLVDAACKRLQAAFAGGR